MKKFWWRLRYAIFMWRHTIYAVSLRNAWGISADGWKLADDGIDSPRDSVLSELSYWDDDEGPHGT